MSPEVPIIILVLAIPIYFLSKWILKKLKLGNATNRKFVAIIPTVLLSPLAYFGIIMIWILSVSYYPTKEFDKQEWKTNIEERYEMSMDLIKSEVLIGKTKIEVIEILGEDYSSNSDIRLIYELGFVPGLFNIDPDFLEIKFEDGKVVSVRQFEG